MDQSLALYLLIAALVEGNINNVWCIVYFYVPSTNKQTMPEDAARRRFDCDSNKGTVFRPLVSFFCTQPSNTAYHSEEEGLGAGIEPNTTLSQHRGGKIPRCSYLALRHPARMHVHHESLARLPGIYSTVVWDRHEVVFWAR